MGIWLVAAAAARWFITATDTSFWVDYNTACTGSCSSPWHAQQEMLAGPHLLPDQTSVVCCSTFVSVLFHIAKAMCWSKQCSRSASRFAWWWLSQGQRSTLGSGRSPLLPSSWHAGFQGSQGGALVLMANYSVANTWGAWGCLNLLLQRTSWAKQHCWWLHTCLYQKRFLVRTASPGMCFPM